MILQNITVGYFKNVEMTSIDLSKITALVSTNNYGKSNLMEAIHFGFDFITASPRNRKRMMSSSRIIPMVPALSGGNFFFSVEFDDPDLQEYRHVKYSFEFMWQNDQKNGAVITDEKLEINAAPDSQKYTSYLKRSDGKFRAGKSNPNFRNIVLSPENLAVDILASYDDIEISHAIQKIQNLRSTICDTLELSSSYTPFPIEFDFMDKSNLFDDDDIPKTLNALRNENPDRFEQFLDTIYQLFPEFEKVELRTYTSVSEKSDSQLDAPFHVRDEIYKLFIKSQYLNQPISMENMSTGTKRIIWLIINSFFGSDYGINLIEVDEIETSIHPKMIKVLLESINEILNNTSMIISSHSPYLIQYLKPESIYIGIPNEYGTAQFKHIKKSRIKDILRISHGLGLSVGEYIFELLSGDEDSIYVLNSYMED